MIARGKKYRVMIFSLIAGWSLIASVSGQSVPGKDENIDFLVTFGKDGKTSWGDFYFRQIFFFTVPKDLKEQFYIRVFDPDCGGENDEIQGEFNSRTMFSVYGGKGVDPEQEVNKESMGLEKTDNYKRGNLLASQVFGGEARYDNKYYTFGPFNPTEGDPNEKWGYIFKVVCEGVAGDDGNLYRYFMSRDPDNNIAVEGGNAFTYIYTFRMWNNFQSVAHIYPYVDQNVVLIKMNNFDWDKDGRILVVSRQRQGSEVKEISNEDEWKEAQIILENEEKNTSIDFQFHKAQAALVKNNNVVITIQNQYDQALKFFSSPIGGVPVYSGAGVSKQKPPSTKPGYKPVKK
jgi:hypothetical protein